MKEVMPRLFVGSDDDFQYVLGRMTHEDSWTVVHAARDPWHREFVGYTTRGAPKDSLEYLYAQRGKRLALNLFDTDDVNYVNPQLMSVAHSYIKSALQVSQDNVLVHCNKGQSRGPTIAMCVMARELGPNFAVAKALFETLYPDYKPMHGLEDHARLYWNAYHEGTF